MYLKLVDFCNMSCAHCGMGCGKEGESMTLKTFRNALKHSDGMITLGGGEPTLNPKFYQILMESIGESENVHIITNGSITKISLTLAKLAEKGVIGAELSQDPYHDEIDERVVEAFTVDRNERQDNDFRGIRDTSDNLVNAGRCDFGESDECICSDIVIEPDGEVRGCGCNDAPVFGNVNGEVNIPSDWNYGECYRNQELENA